MILAAATAGADLRVTLAALLPFVIASLALAIWWVYRMRERGGRVDAAHFGSVDLIVACLLITMLGLISYYSFALPKKQELQLSVQALLMDSEFKLAVLLLLGLVLAFRRVPAAETPAPATIIEPAVIDGLTPAGSLPPPLPVRPLPMVRLGFDRMFGFRGLPLLHAIGYAALFLVAAMPVLLLLTVLVSGHASQGDEQQIVTFFRAQAKSGDYRGLLAVVFTASLLAPFWEELIFRGYLYGTLKRYLGPVAAVVLVSLLFAVVHGNLVWLPSLFVLACFLTVAYEWTGSLLVSILMHATFNTMNLLFMYVQVTRSAP